MTGDVALAALLKRDRIPVLVALLVLTALAWSYVIWLASQMTVPDVSSTAGMPDIPDMSDMPGMDMNGMNMLIPAFTPWTPAHFLFMFAMWAVMMVGMMTPSVAPMILIYTRVARQSAARGHPFAPAAWFAGGYLLAWIAFSLAAAAAQWALEALALVTPMMGNADRTFGGVLLVIAGAYQWLPFKDSCLAQCRAPLSFVQRHGGFRQEASGSVRLGFLHGLYCIGCCWAVMLLLFVGGVMNLLWVAALMIFVLLEKIIPGGRAISRVAGLAALTVGIWMIAGGQGR